MRKASAKSGPPSALPQALPRAKRKLLDAAMALMLKHGYAATTVDGICAAAKLTKGSFFHYFESKEDIAAATLDHYCAQRAEQMARASFHREADPLEKFHGILDHFITLTSGPKPGSCLLGNVAQELAQTHPRFQRQCADRFGQLASLLAGALRAAKVAHPPASDFDPESVATLFVSVVQGSMLLAKAQRKSTVTRENIEHFRHYMEGLFGRARRRQAGK